jgi:hypothetical protein
VLSALEQFRALHPGANLTQILAYLYVAENEGLSVTELSYALATTVATASRTVRGLYGPDHPEAVAPAIGLLEPRLNPAIPHARLLYLTREGDKLRHRIDGLVSAGVRIAQPELAA